MPPKKIPTSPLSGSYTAYFLSLYLTAVTATVLELLSKRVLSQTLAGIRKIGSEGVSPEASTTHRSPATRLPLEVVEIIIAYLRYDTRSLRACTQTCRSWYIAAVPHLHHTLTVLFKSTNGRKLMWPNSIRDRHRLGLLPLVKEFRLQGGYPWLSPDRFTYCALRRFSALTNVQKLEINCLNIPSFMPRIKQYFGHFLPTVRSLVLKGPMGSPRQIIYFIGLFRDLEDLELTNQAFLKEQAGDPTLVPTFIPPLRGSLKLAYFNGAKFWKDMINLFGGIRFRHMDLYEMNGEQSFLDACAETLESVVLDPIDCGGEQLSLKGIQALADYFVVQFSHWSRYLRLSLSRNKSLRTLLVPWSSIIFAPGGGSPSTSAFFKHMLSTITPSVPFKILVLYTDNDFSGLENRRPERRLIRKLWWVEREEEVSRHRRIFEVFREVQKVRKFQLELCASVWGSVGEEPVQILEEAIAKERTENGFNDFPHDPSVVYNPRRARF